MSRFNCAIMILAATPCLATAQVPPKLQAADPLAPVRRAVSLAERGNCSEALPALKRTLSQIQDKPFRYRAAIAAVRCAMSLNDTAAAAETLSLLRRDFPDDPEALYNSARYFSQLGERTARELAARFPDSPQVGKLNAEALESKQLWKEAIGAYRKVLTQNPKMTGIHFRIATILLDTSSSAETAAEAKKELEAELEINPDHASAVFVLGEIARLAGSWDEAIQFSTNYAQLLMSLRITPGLLATAQRRGGPSPSSY